MMNSMLRMLGISPSRYRQEGAGLLIIYLKSGHTLKIKGKATIQRSKKDINIIQITSDSGDYECPVNSIVASFNNWKDDEK